MHDDGMAAEYPPPQSLLPDDVLQEEVLPRLPPRALAVCRSVCKSWRGAIDACRMLRSDLLPLWPCGIFVNTGGDPRPPVFFAPPYVGRKVTSKFNTYVGMMGDRSWPRSAPVISAHCNGLLLMYNDGQNDDYVMNPATRRSERLPLCQGEPCDERHLLFDPSLSPHYQVLLFQSPDDYQADAGSEWPPSPFAMWVYSSATRRWEKRSFTREGQPAAGTLAEVHSAEEPIYYRRQSVYFHGALYAHCKGDFIMRITLPDSKYQVIEPPQGINSSVQFDLRLVKCKNGVYLAYMGKTLKAWFLNESAASGKAWVLKYDVNLQAVNSHFSSQDSHHPINMPWLLHHADNNKGNNARVRSVEKFQWDSDNGNIVKIKKSTDGKFRGSGWIHLLGFHPYKEVAFLQLSNNRAVACHLDLSKVQDLGHFDLPFYRNHSYVNGTFVYSPCWMGDLCEQY
ncbi:hypothetical protein U9M48_004927 [Paspalum notatum var. saurae]|uniref:F-box domain-containing protein n=1 Tax=Paspalum notatum var. saurae TaxID=547442 RepID=A0AAQ3SJG1_PASNO